jgi:hypothetical protein
MGRTQGFEGRLGCQATSHEAWSSKTEGPGNHGFGLEWAGLELLAKGAASVHPFHDIIDIYGKIPPSHRLNLVTCKLQVATVASSTCMRIEVQKQFQTNILRLFSKLFGVIMIIEEETLEAKRDFLVLVSMIVTSKFKTISQLESQGSSQKFRA